MCVGVVDGLSQPMGEQVRRSHLLNELRIEFPSTRIVKTFSFNENFGSVDG